MPMVELVGGPLDGMEVSCPESMIEGGQILWVCMDIRDLSITWVALGPGPSGTWYPYWCETDGPADLEHHASFYPKAWNDPE